VKAQNINVLLFDLDGTLVDSAPDLSLAINRMLTDLHLPIFDQDIIRSWVGNGAQTLVERALSGSTIINEQLDKAQLNYALAIFLQHYQNGLCIQSALYDNVKETLIKLKHYGYRLAIITNKPEQFIAPIIHGLELDGLFELQLGGDSLAKRKPDPLPLHHACKVLEVSEAECIMIGDSKNDILAAKAANMASVGLTYGYNYGEDIAQSQPEWRLENFADLLKILPSKTATLPA